MSEETNVLEEIEALLETASTAETKESRTPIEDFALWLRDLGDCASYRSSFVFLDRSKADVLAADASEAFAAKATCRKRCKSA